MGKGVTPQRSNIKHGVGKPQAADKKQRFDFIVVTSEPSWCSNPDLEEPGHNICAVVFALNEAQAEQHCRLRYGAYGVKTVTKSSRHPEKFVDEVIG